MVSPKNQNKKLDCLGAWIIGGLFVFYSFNISLQDREQLLSNGHEFYVIETKYPLGSMFNKDAIKITANAIILYKRNFFESKEISLPYKKVEKIVVTDGLFWDSITVETHGLLSENYTIYTRTDESRKNLKSVIEVLDLEIVEQNTIWKNFLGGYKEFQ